MEGDFNGTASGDFGFSMTSPAAGYIAICISAFGFGTNYLPIKKYAMGDGMFFQWVMCNAILLVGVIVNCAVGCPQFYPLAMLGGALWAIGNSLIVTVIEAIGVGVGILIWSMTNMLFGFASSRFGWFGIPMKIPSKPIMNYIGVAIALGSVILYAAIKPNQKSDDSCTSTDICEPINGKTGMEFEEATGRGSKCSFCKPITKMPLNQRRIIGILFSIMAGAFFGNTFVPTIYIQGRFKGSSQQGLDYVFSNFVGIWITSTAILVFYICIKRNRPFIILPNAILPALISGLLWGVAQSAWFVANAALGEPITFPIVTTVPALIATLCGLFFFKEIKGRRNYILLGCAFCVTTTGVILNALSK